MLDGIAGLGRSRRAWRIVVRGGLLVLTFSAGAVLLWPSGAQARRIPGAPSVIQAGSPTPEPTYVPWSPSGAWTVVHSSAVAPLWPSAPTLRGLHLRQDPDGIWRGWAVGEDGVLARFDGADWTAVKDFDPKTTAPKTYDFHDVFVAAADDVWLVGRVSGETFCGADACGTVLHYDGARWRELDRYEGYRVNGKMGALNAIDMQQDANGDWYGWIVGDDAAFDRYKAVILGYTPTQGWRIWPSHNIAKNLNDVRMVSTVEAWAVGQDGVESRYNEEGGEGLWPPQGRSGSDTLYAVDMAERLSGWDGGFRGRLNKYRGHCHDEDPTTACWFQNEAMPIRTTTGGQWAITVYGIDLLDRHHGWLVGAASGRVSTVAWLSGAKDWTLFPVDGDPGKDLRGLQMLSEASGYAVGAGGVILRYQGVEAPTAPPTPTASATASRTPTATASATAAPSGTPTEVIVPTSTNTAPPTDAPTGTATGPSATAPPSPESPTPDPSGGTSLYAPLVARRS